MEKIVIQNRNGLKLVVVVEKAKKQKGLVFIEHGLSGNKEQQHIRAFAEAFKKNNYTVVTFDTGNTFGESYGNIEDVTVTQYLKDLEDVIDWAKTQDFYEEPFVLCGHSLGSFAVSLYAEKFPEKVKGLAPLSTVISGKLSQEARSNTHDIEEWKKKGYIERVHELDKFVYKIKWSDMDHRLRYDLLQYADKFMMPVILIVGELDDSTPPEHQQLLFSAIPHNKKEMHIINGSEHTFRTPEQLEKVTDLLDKWIKSL